MKTITIFLWTLLLAFTCSAQIVTSGNIAKYYFNSGNPHDEIGSNDGVIYGAVLTEDRFGNSNKAFLFNNAFIRIDHNEELDLGNGDFSISAWFKTDNDSNYCAIFNKGEGTVFKPRIFIRTMGSQQSTLQWRVGDGVNNVTLSYSDALYFDDQWHHVVLIRKDISLFLYLDGIQIDETTNFDFPNINTNSNRPILIGVQDSIYNNSGNVGFGNYFDGSLDDFRIYNRAVNSLEVDSLYREQDPVISALSNISKLGLKIYPIPVQDYLSIESNEDSKIDRYKIYDITGKLNQSGSLNLNPLDIRKLNTGVYFIQLYIGKELVGIKKFIKKQVY